MSNPATLAATVAGADAIAKDLGGPRGPRPRVSFSRRNIFIYGTLIFAAIYYLIPLYVMVVTSLKGMPEIRLGNIFSPPMEITFEPWVKAWATACTGLNCDGLSRGFWNSVRITVPSVILSIAIASVNGYALANWRFKGADIFFTILIVGAFIPYQVMIYPIVIMLREIGLYGTLTGLVIVHSIFGMPILTLLFRNYFASLPEELFKAARVDGAGFWGIYFRIMLPMSLPIFVVAIILQVTGIWNDFLFGVVYTRPDTYPMTVQLNNIVNSVAGREGIQRQHGRDPPHRPGAAGRLLHLRKTVRARHRRRRGERLGGGMTSVAIKDLSLNFGAVSVLKDLNLDVEDGEFLVLLGPSGCGKSTLLNCIAGLLDVSDGQIFIKGKNVTWEEPKDRGIGMVFQSYALYPQMTVKGNLSFGLKNAGLPKDEIERRIARTAEILQIEPLLDRKPSQLSGGQRQRVAIGRALVRDVDVFLFDEPLSNLDAKLRSELRVEIKRLHQKLANTMIYVTHDQIEAMTLADRIAVMKGGLIQQLGRPQDIYSRPVNRFVAGFIGSPGMNFLDGEVTVRDGSPRFLRRRARHPARELQVRRDRSESPAPRCSASGRSMSASIPARAGLSRARSRSRSSSRWAPTRWSGRSSASRTSPSASLRSARRRRRHGHRRLRSDERLAVRRRVGRTALGSINENRASQAPGIGKGMRE